jgi:pimeloyl-ACP methyl ester carboxylesterase
MTQTPLILFAGMGADERLFAAQKAAFPQLTVPPWIKPIRGESLNDYALRFARQIDPGVPCYIGGASLGGFIAMAASQHVRGGKACFLIGSVKGPHELPRRIRALRTLARWLPWIPFGWLAPAVRWGMPVMGLAMRPSVRSMLQQLTDADAEFLRWACGAVLRWEPAKPSRKVLVFHIHGERDHVLPVRHTRPDVVVPGAGHLVPLTHAREVNEFLGEVINRFEKAETL